MQRVLGKTKCHLEKKEYKKLYPTGSKPGLFYGTAKVHKLKIGEGLKEQTVRPIISNTGTATYKTAKYLNTLLTPLTKSQYNILSTDNLIEKIKSERIPKGFEKVSFDVKNLFTIAPLHQAIEIILPKVYQDKKIKTSIPKNILRELLYLCTKEVHFMFNDEIYIQSDGVAMGSRLGALLAHIFMTSLEEEVVPKLTPYLSNWKRYVDDTYAYADPEKVDFVLTKLSSYHPNIQFIFVLEKNKQITFLNVLVKRTVANQIETCVHRKETSTNLYINWNSHAPMEWKIGTLVKRTKTVCSTTVLLHQEIEHLRAIFTGINEYPIKTVNTIINQELHRSQRLQNTVINNEGIKKLQIMLPYNGKQGNKLLLKMKKHLNKSLPTEVKQQLDIKVKNWERNSH